MVNDPPWIDDDVERQVLVDDDQRYERRPFDHVCKPGRKLLSIMFRVPKTVVNPNLTLVGKSETSSEGPGVGLGREPC